MLTPTPHEVNMDSATPTEPKGYNGWTNYETWAWALWMDNEPGTYDAARESARDAYRNAEVPAYMGPDMTRRRWAGYELSKTLKDEAEEAAEENVTAGTVWADLIGAALSEVNWREIAENLIDEVADDIDAEEAEEEAEDEEEDDDAE